MRKYQADVFIAVTLYFDAENDEAAQAIVDGADYELTARDLRLDDGVVMSPAVTWYPEGIQGDNGLIVERTKAFASRCDEDDEDEDED